MHEIGLAFDLGDTVIKDIGLFQRPKLRMHRRKPAAAPWRPPLGALNETTPNDGGASHDAASTASNDGAMSRSPEEPEERVAASTTYANKRWAPAHLHCCEIVVPGAEMIHSPIVRSAKAGAAGLIHRTQHLRPIILDSSSSSRPHDGATKTAAPRLSLQQLAALLIGDTIVITVHKHAPDDRVSTTGMTGGGGFSWPRVPNLHHPHHPHLHAQAAGGSDGAGTRKEKEGGAKKRATVAPANVDRVSSKHRLSAVFSSRSSPSPGERGSACIDVEHIISQLRSGNCSNAAMSTSGRVLA